MRIIDWSSDVCSAELVRPEAGIDILATKADDFNIVSIEEAILQACINVLRDGHTNASQSLPGKYGIRVIDDVFRILTHARDTSATADKSLQAVIRAEAHQTIQHKRSEERRVGKECISTCSSRWSP